MTGSFSAASVRPELTIVVTTTTHKRARLNTSRFPHPSVVYDPIANMTLWGNNNNRGCLLPRSHTSPYDHWDSSVPMATRSLSTGTTRYRAADLGEEIASFQPIEMHRVPDSGATLVDTGFGRSISLARQPSCKSAS
jgi:hypothetical protein